MLCLSLAKPLQAQQPDNNFTEFWSDLTLSKFLNEQWTIGGDLGLRFLDDNDFRQIYVRPTIHYTLSPLYNFSFGLASFNTFSELIDTYEIRIYQDANINWPRLGIFNFSHRFRFEERFFGYSTDLESAFEFRGRYMLSTRTDNFSLGGKAIWAVFTSLEPFFRLGGGEQLILANNFRWDTALSYQATKQLRVELHYILQTSEVFSNRNADLNEHIIRLRLFQSF